MGQNERLLKPLKNLLLMSFCNATSMFEVDLRFFTYLHKIDSFKQTFISPAAVDLGMTGSVWLLSSPVSLFRRLKTRLALRVRPPIFWLLTGGIFLSRNENTRNLLKNTKRKIIIEFDAVILKLCAYIHVGDSCFYIAI